MVKHLTVTVQKAKLLQYVSLRPVKAADPGKISWALLDFSFPQCWKPKKRDVQYWWRSAEGLTNCTCVWNCQTGFSRNMILFPLIYDLLTQLKTSMRHDRCKSLTGSSNQRARSLLRISAFHSGYYIKNIGISWSTSFHLAKSMHACTTDFISVCRDSHLIMGINHIKTSVFLLSVTVNV